MVWERYSEERKWTAEIHSRSKGQSFVSFRISLKLSLVILLAKVHTLGRRKDTKKGKEEVKLKGGCLIIRILSICLVVYILVG